MDKKKIVSLGLVLVLSLGSLTACSKNTGADVATEVVTVDTASVQKFQTYEDQPEAREYAPYEHVFFVRYYNFWDLRGGTIEIPEGYELLDVKYYNEKVGYGSQSNYADVWLVNTEYVLVEPLYNDRTLTYDYSQPGSIILEKDDVSVTEDKKVK